MKFHLTGRILRGDFLRHLANLLLTMMKTFEVEIAKAGLQQGAVLIALDTVKPNVALASGGMLRRLLAIEMAHVIRGHQQRVHQHAL